VPHSCVRWTTVAGRAVAGGRPHTQRARDELGCHVPWYQVALLPARQDPRQVPLSGRLVQPGLGDGVRWFQQFGVDRGHKPYVIESDGHFVGDRRADATAAEQIGTGGTYRPDRVDVGSGHRRYRAAGFRVGVEADRLDAEHSELLTQCMGEPAVRADLPVLRVDQEQRRTGAVAVLDRDERTGQRLGMVAQQGGQAFHGRVFGQHVQRELDAELHQDGVDHPGGVQRVAADAEEVLPDPDREAEEVLPLPGQPDLRRIPGVLVAGVDRLVEGRIHGGVAPFS
jgi:hypothetical protein